jgi:hypothetical protein
MGGAADNSKESSHSAHGNRMNIPDFIVSYIFYSQMSFQVRGLVSMRSVSVVNALLGY